MNRLVNESVELSDDGRKHLEFVQGTITRLAASSSSTKTWAITIGLAGYGLSRTQSQVGIMISAVVVVTVLATLDAHYLREERLFRYLFDDASQNRLRLYSMDKGAYKHRCRFVSSLFSWSIVGYYGTLIVLGGAAVATSLAMP